MPNVVPRLMVRDAAGHEHEVEITQTPFTLGRQSDNDLVLLDNRISRQHARIVYDGHGYILEDSSSRHGTYVNGERIERCRLKDGDQLSLGVSDAYSLTFVLEEATLARLLEDRNSPGKLCPAIATAQLPAPVGPDAASRRGAGRYSHRRGGFRPATFRG